MRNLEAGTYYLRVYDPFAVDLYYDEPFTLEFLPPIPGQTHPARDRDLLTGGDGDDVLIGSGQLDRTFGESGDDAFVAEVIEVFDFDDDETQSAARVRPQQHPATADRPGR